MPKAIVIGGSLSGLFTGVLLRSAGWDVEVYERSVGVLESQGGGIVVRPELIELYRKCGLGEEGPVGTQAGHQVILGRDGELTSVVAIPQTHCSWNTIHHDFRAALPDNAYYAGFNLERIDMQADQVWAVFDNGHQSAADLLVGADGATSTVRGLLFPSMHVQYAGYVAWRGVVATSRLDGETRELLHDRLAFQELCDFYMLGYPLVHPTGDLAYNWVWFRPAQEATDLPAILTDGMGRRRRHRVGPGHLAPAVEAELRTVAASLLCPPFQKVVRATEQPFVQAILEVCVPHMVQGRVALLGEAAFVSRPHGESSTARAATHVMELVGALGTCADVPTALQAWEPQQLRLGQAVLDHGRTWWPHRDPVESAW